MECILLWRSLYSDTQLDVPAGIRSRYLKLYSLWIPLCLWSTAMPSRPISSFHTQQINCTELARRSDLELFHLNILFVSANIFIHHIGIYYPKPPIICIIVIYHDASSMNPPPHHHLILLLAQSLTQRALRHHHPFHYTSPKPPQPPPPRPATPRSLSSENPDTSPA